MKDLAKLIKTMRTNGILKYKTSEIELELHPAAFMFPVEQSEAKEEAPKAPYTEEEMLMWSAPGSRAV